MKYLLRIVRGIAAGLILFVLAYGTSLLVGNWMYPMKFDTYLISPDIGSFSPSAFAHHAAMPRIFLVTASVYLVVYIVVYLYLRNRYYKKISQATHSL